MRMRPQCVITLIVLAIWVFVHPVMMAFNDCDRIGETCADPCLHLCSAEPTLLSAAEPLCLRDLLAQLSEHPPPTPSQSLAFPP